MKKVILIILFLALFTSVPASCSYQNKDTEIKRVEVINKVNNDQDIRKAAYDQLNAEDKERIKGTWEDSKSSKIILNENMGIIKDKSYIGKEVYIIDFPTKSISKPNNMIVFLSIDTNKLLGYGYVE
jgi:hypothetical protein